MPGPASILTVEDVLNESKPYRGYVEDVPVPLRDWSLGSGAAYVATTSNIVGYGASATSLNGFVWDPGADTGDTLRLDWTTPGQFAPQPSTLKWNPVLEMHLCLRVRDKTGSASANTDLAMTCQAFWFKSGDTALSTLSSAVSNIIGATIAQDSHVEQFAWYRYNLVGAMTAAQKLALGPRQPFQFVIAPDDTVGTNLQIDMVGSFIRYRRHASLAQGITRP